ncbi:hypothetical protein [Qipengyuania gelatinilytica]|uniref:Uncharacterized protein n=1 Tax=Qipengyuania gelatinilytica TaxID=2867231 RepID=A0ABX9A105_9SPHN|nr:hypothetical protein [Qipengyuania gelatinilytica]QZD94930.1 hypothetical protein K3136_12745 [Qipengyuania gelatinilytica]
MRRLTPYIFFLLAIIAFAMIAFDKDDSWQTEQVDALDAVLITAGVLIGAHLLRKLAEVLYARWKTPRE